MESDEYLIKFQGSLLSMSNKGLLDKPPDGNQIEGGIRKYEIEELSNFVTNIPNSAKRKIAYYMILNTELTVSDDLKNDEFIGLFVNLTPAIPHQALIKWIYTLNLFNEFCKAIENLPSVLSTELISRVLENQSFATIKNIYFTLWCAVFKNICKTEKENCLISPEIFNHFKIISQNVEKCLDLGDITCENLSLFLEFLTAVLNLVTYYKNPGPDDDMYKLSIELKGTTSVTAPNEESIKFVFKTLSNILNRLNFEEWNNSFSCTEEWNTIRNLGSRLLQEIGHIEVPANVLDILSNFGVKESHATIESLILDAKCGQKFNWTRGIINPGVAEHNNCPLEIMNGKDLDVLLDGAYRHLETSGEEMKELFLAAVILSHNPYKWLSMVFDKYQPNLLMTSNTSKDLVEIFNRISNTENIQFGVIVSLCMQSPIETVKKLCHHVIATKAADIQVFYILKPVCEVLLPSGVTLLGHVIVCLLSEELTSAEEDYFRRFVVKLRKGNLINGAFLENLIKELRGFLENCETNKAVLCLTVIDSILVETEPVNIIALLVFMSQVLGHFSWDLGTFSMVKANGRDIVCSTVNKLMTRLDCNTNREVLNLAREEILKGWKVNQACFCDLWFKFGETWDGSGKFDSLILALIHSSCSRCELRQFLLTFGPPDEVRISIILTLTKVLPVLTLNFWGRTLTELTGVWAEMNPSEGSSINYEVFRMFTTAWYLLTLQLNMDSNIQPCYKYCMGGFGRLFSSASLEGESLVRAYETILFIVKSIENEEIRKSCYVILFPVLKDRLASSSQKGTRARFEKIQKILSEELTN